MKTLISALIVATALSASASALAANSQYTCDYPLFHAYTEKGNKEVLLCVSGDAVSYTFGKRDVEKAELDVRAAKSDVHVYNYRYGSEIEFPNGDYTYTVDDMSDEDGKPVKQLIVQKGGKKLTTIALGNIVLNNLSSDLGSYGIETE